MNASEVPPRPNLLAINWDCIPAMVKAYDQWVLFKLEPKQNNRGEWRWTKVPYRPNGYNADITKSEHHSKYELVKAAFEQGGFDGIGFAFTTNDPFVGIDLDHVLQSADRKRWAMGILQQIDSYSEKSVAGSGYHCIAIGTLPEWGRKAVDIEMYASQHYFTFSGQTVSGISPTVERRDVQVNALFHEWFPARQKPEPQVQPEPGPQHTDDEILERTRKYIGFAFLFDGILEPYQSTSEAVLPFLTYLRRVGASKEQMDRLFRQSGLMYEHWDRRNSGTTWGALQIEKVWNDTQPDAEPGSITGEISFRIEGVQSSRWGVSAMIRAFAGDTQVDYTRLTLDDSWRRKQWALSLSQDTGGNARELKHKLDALCEEHLTPSINYTEDVLFVPTLTGDDAEYALSPYILNGEGTICFGPRSSGKTWLSLLMAVCLDAGISTYWPVEKARPILFINLERDKRVMSRRLRKVNRFLGLDAERPLHILNCRGMNMTQVYPIAEKACRDANIEVTFTDSVLPAIAAPGITVKDDEAANALTKMLNNLTPTWFLLAHVGHGDPTRPIGSTVYGTAPNILIGVKSQEKRPEEQKIGIALHMTKNNDGPGGIAPVQYWSLEEVGSEISWSYAEKGEYPEIDRLEKPDDDANRKPDKRVVAHEIHKFLIEHPGSGTLDIAEGLERYKSKVSADLNNPKNMDLFYGTEDGWYAR